jgi:serine/threonine-protein kinase HipA
MPGPNLQVARAGSRGSSTSLVKHEGTSDFRSICLIVVNCALRNGDAHLKNFGIVYDDVQGEARLAPVYDLVTTAVYLPKDKMALTLYGTTNWPRAKELLRLGETRIGVTPARIRQIMERVGQAIADASQLMRAYMKEHPEFEEIGGRMLQQWERGLETSVKAV